MNGKYTICEIKCLNCGRWFKSPIQFGNAESFFTAKTLGNKVRCPLCGEQTGCNKDNMRFGERRDDGRITYVEGKDTI